mmetsp:Transcript_37127/g.104799  ORF Transcript_37127/g.104799 Transcript_37127/m.104799 type:complete len:219 (-) Transcript_37127:193-849(-)
MPALAPSSAPAFKTSANFPSALGDRNGAARARGKVFASVKSCFLQGCSRPRQASGSTLQGKQAARRGWRQCAAVADAPATASSEGQGSATGRELALAIAEEADMLKGKDIMVLHVEPIASWTSYMVLVTVFSRPQMQAMLFKIGKMALEKYDRALPYTKQTSQGKEWECMDFGEVVVQVMTTEARDFYDLESFYAQAEEVELPFEGESTSGSGWQKKQ